MPALSRYTSAQLTRWQLFNALISV